MTITGQSSLAKDDIERMVRDAEAHAEDDRSAARRPRSATTPTPSCTRPRSSSVTRATSSRVPRRRPCRAALQDGEGRPGGHRRRGHQDGHRVAHDGQPGLLPAALRAGFAGQRVGRRSVGLRQQARRRRRRGRRRRDRRRAVTCRPEPDFPGTPLRAGARGGRGERTTPTRPSTDLADVDAGDAVATAVRGDPHRRRGAHRRARRVPARAPAAQADFENYRKRVVRQQEEQGEPGRARPRGQAAPGARRARPRRRPPGQGRRGRGGRRPRRRRSARPVRSLLDDAGEGGPRAGRRRRACAFDPAVHDAVGARPPRSDDGRRSPGRRDRRGAARPATAGAGTVAPARHGRGCRG